MSALIKNPIYSQFYWDLAEVDEGKRQKAASGIVRFVSQAKVNQESEIDYALKRLTRGVTSSRACSRQGFCLALTEFLREVPVAMVVVMKAINDATNLAEASSRERNDRLLGRMFSFLALFEAGCFKNPEKWGGDEKFMTTISTVAAGVWDVFTNLLPCRQAASLLLLTLAEGIDVKYRSALKIERKLERTDYKKRNGSQDSDMCIDLIGLTLTLRWKSENDMAFMKVADLLDEGNRAKTIAAMMRQFMSASSQTNKPHFSWRAALRLAVLSPTRDAKLLRELLAAMDSTLCRESTNNVERRLHEKVFAMRCFLDALSFVALRASVNLDPNEFFKVCWEAAPQTVAFIFQSLTRGSRCTLYPAANLAMSQFVNNYTGKSGQKRSKGAQRWVDVGSDFVTASLVVDLAKPFAAQPVELTDATRLDALWTCVAHVRQLSKMHMELLFSVLVAPLGPEAVQKLVEKLFDLLISEDPMDRQWACDRLVSLTKHTNITDNTILAIMGFLMLGGYCLPADVQGHYVMKLGDKDMKIPIMPELQGEHAEGDRDESLRKLCVFKFWGLLSAMTKRASPEKARSFNTVHTHAFDGMLIDGSFWIGRMHEWYNHFMTTKALNERGEEIDAKKLTTCGKLEKTRVKAVALAEKLRVMATSKAKDHARAVNQIAMVLYAGALQIPKHDLRRVVDDKTTEDYAQEESLAEEELEGLSSLMGVLSGKKLSITPEILAEVGRILPEICLNNVGLMKEITRSAWRECCGYISDEVLANLLQACVVTAEIPEGDEPEEESDDEEGSDSEEDLDPEEFARQQEQADAIMAKIIPQGDVDEDGVAAVENANFLEMLLDEDDPMLAMSSEFIKNASSLSKKKEAQRQKQSEVHHQLRSLGLVETYITRQQKERPDACLRVMEHMIDMLMENSGRPGKKAVASITEELTNGISSVIRAALKGVVKAKMSVGQAEQMADKVLEAAISRAGIADICIEVFIALSKIDPQAAWVKEKLAKTLIEWATKRDALNVPDFFRRVINQQPTAFLSIKWGDVIQEARTVFRKRETLMLFLTCLRNPLFLDNDPEGLLVSGITISCDLLAQAIEKKLEFASNKKSREFQKQVLTGLYSCLELVRTYFDQCGKFVIDATAEMVLKFVENAQKGRDVKQQGWVNDTLKRVREEVSLMKTLKPGDNFPSVFEGRKVKKGKTSSNDRKRRRNAERKAREAAENHQNAENPETVENPKKKARKGKKN